MKKFLAILLSVLMLCSVIPFAAVSVSAEDVPTIVVIPDADELNAGDEFEISVQLLNNPGVNAATVEITYDKDVFELCTEWVYDEDLDEDVEANMIEVAKGWSSKYITPAPLGKCLVSFINGLATKNVTKEDFFTATLKVKDDAVSGDYELTVVYNPKAFTNIEKEFVAFETQNATVTVNGSEPEVPSCEHEYEYDCSKVCSKCGEETRPEAEHQYLYACDQYCNECGEKSNPGAKHIITHVEAKEAVSCIEYGNIEYWRCESCGAVWKDANGRYQTNMMSILVAAECVSNAPACQDGECVNCGLPCYAEAEHTYANAHDASCDVCGTIRELVLKAEDIIIAGGTSVSEKKNGLAFKFDAAINGITWNEEYTADYSNATVTIEGVEYKLVGMGVIANNKGYESQTAEDVDGKYVLNVPAVKVYEDAEGNTSYSIRVLNIPADKLDAEITVRSYYQYEVDGEIVTVYGQDWTSSYNDAR